MGKISKTERGFNYYEFNDRYGEVCSIQESSLASEDCIWFGINDPEPKIMASKVQEGGVGWVKYPIPEDVLISTRMHLNKKQVSELIPILQTFLETGRVRVQ